MECRSSLNIRENVKFDKQKCLNHSDQANRRDTREARSRIRLNILRKTRQQPRPEMMPSGNRGPHKHRPIQTVCPRPIKSKLKTQRQFKNMRHEEKKPRTRSGSTPISAARSREQIQPDDRPAALAGHASSPRRATRSHERETQVCCGTPSNQTRTVRPNKVGEAPVSVRSGRCPPTSNLNCPSSSRSDDQPPTRIPGHRGRQ